MILNDQDYYQSIYTVLRRIEDNMALPPAPIEPVINIEPPDLAAIVTAVTSLKPGPTADEIARAISGVLLPTVPSPPADMSAMVRALEALDFRLKGMGPSVYGGSSVAKLDPSSSVSVHGDVSITGSVEVSNDDGNPLPVRQFASTSATTDRVPSSATVVTLLTMNPLRNQAIIYNESTQTLKIKLGSGASATDYTLPIAGGTPTGGYYELPVRYTGIITGIWDLANGFAQITEF